MRWKLLFFIAIICTTIGYVYSSQEFEEIVLIRDIVNDDLYTAGQSVQIAARVHGDVTAAAQRISIEETVDGDINAAAEIVTLSAPVGDDVRAAGRLITLSAAVGDHIIAAGESITISSKASVQGWAKLAGRQVTVLGDIGKHLTVVAQHAVIGGKIQGDVEVMADTIVILSTANINGKLIYRSPNKPDIQSGAVINGAIEQQPIPIEDAGPAALKVAVGILLVSGMALLIFGITYSLLFPHFSLISARTLGEQPLRSIGLGVVVLLVTPFIIFLLMMTVVGYLLALCLLAVFLILLLLGIVTSVLYIADLGLRRMFKKTQTSKGKRILAFMVASIICAILVLIPILGGILLVLMLIAGMGALQIQLWRHYSAAEA